MCYQNKFAQQTEHECGGVGQINEHALQPPQQHVRTERPGQPDHEVDHELRHLGHQEHLLSSEPLKM